MRNVQLIFYSVDSEISLQRHTIFFETFENKKAATFTSNDFKTNSMDNKTLFTTILDSIKDTF